MMRNQNKKRFDVHRVIGRYQIDGAITCIPAPRPGVETALVKLLIDERVANMVKNRMLEDCFAGDPIGPVDHGIGGAKDMTAFTSCKTRGWC